MAGALAKSFVWTEQCPESDEIGRVVIGLNPQPERCGRNSYSEVLASFFGTNSLRQGMMLCILFGVFSQFVPVASFSTMIILYRWLECSIYPYRLDPAIQTANFSEIHIYALESFLKFCIGLHSSSDLFPRLRSGRAEYWSFVSQGSDYILLLILRGNVPQKSTRAWNFGTNGSSWESF